MKKLALVTILATVIAQPAMAVSNVWSSGFGQGWTEYSIADSKGQSLVIACNDGYDDITDHKISFAFKNGKSLEGSQLEFVIDGAKRGALYLPSSTTNGAKDWESFTASIAKGKVIEVYANNKKVATFKPTKSSIKEVVSGGLCSPMP